MKFTKSLFHKLLLAAAALIVVTVATLDLYVTNYVADREVQHVRERLAMNASLAHMDLGRIRERAAAGLSVVDVTDWASEVARRTQARVTLVSSDGKVLADSDSDAATMENHAQRPEFQESLEGRVGENVRRSATLNQDFFYYAIPVEDAGPVASLRMAVPLERLNRATTDVRERMLFISLGVLAFALALAWIMSRRFSKRVEQLGEFAHRIADRRAVEPLKVDSLDELGSLGHSLNRTSQQLGEFVHKLENESRSLDTILSSMGEGVLAIDAEMRLTFCNPAFARAMGMAYPVVGHPPLAMLLRNPSLLDLLQQVITTRKAHNDQLRLSARLFIVHAVPFGPKATYGGESGALAIFHDITDIERLERVRRDFVSNASHELRTPISAIQGYVETLLDGAIDDQDNNRRFLETIRSNAIRLKDITADLLILSELEAGSARRNEVFSLRTAVDSAARAAGPEALARQVTLVQEEVANVDVQGSRLRLEQALINLLTNAAKFNRPEGTVRIGARLLAREGELEAVEIYVSDTGIGIPEPDLPRIFERFYRVDKARSREVGGTGLGLSIVRHAVEAMGGTVRVESKMGEGSTFTITLPAVVHVADAELVGG